MYVGNNVGKKNDGVENHNDDYYTTLASTKNISENKAYLIQLNMHTY